jgi:hypothetical protein
MTKDELEPYEKLILSVKRKMTAERPEKDLEAHK